jgi:hypothetical protein
MGGGTASTSLQLAVTSQVLMQVVQVYISVYSAEQALCESGVSSGIFDYHVSTRGGQSRSPTQRYLKLGIFPTAD